MIINVKGGSSCCLGELQGEWAAGKCPWKGRGLCWVPVQLRGSRGKLPSKSKSLILLLLLDLGSCTGPQCQVTLSGGTGATALQMFPVVRGRKRSMERSMQLGKIDT